MKATSWMLLLFTACGGSTSNNTNPDGNNHGIDAPPGTVDSNNPLVDAPPGSTDAPVSGGARTVFVVVMENESSSAIYGSANAPYINNTLLPMSANSTNFTDELPSAIPSEPHYVWMEAGTNQFADKTFLTDVDASASNSTSSTAHLVTQLKAANLDWITYQEGMTAGTCPISSISATFYVAKHDPFVFFQDVSGATPSASTPYCVSHHKPYSSFVADLAAGTMPAYVFIAPNLCHDMHGASGCPAGSIITAGDTWLSTEMPRLLTYAGNHDAVIYLIWDEGSSNQTIPFLAFGQHIKVGASAATYSHSSLLKSIEEQLGVSVLPTVSGSTDFAAMFQPGHFP